MSFNELIAAFESTLLGAIATAATRCAEPSLASELRHFVADEERHVLAWHDLNRRSDPELYRATPHVFLPRVTRAQAILSPLVRASWSLPCVAWIALALEDHSLEMSRRCLRAPRDEIDPVYRAMYDEHRRDEARHVALDCRLIDLAYTPLSTWKRRLCADLVLTLLTRWFLPPLRMARRVLRQLVAEDHSLHALLPRMEDELRMVGSHPGYRAMMYSRKATPTLFKRFDADPVMRDRARCLPTYQPLEVGHA